MFTIIVLTLVVYGGMMLFIGAASGGAKREKKMARALEVMASIAMFGAWLAGTVLAVGWWKVLAVFFPPYAFYLCAEKAMQMAGLI